MQLAAPLYSLFLGTEGLATQEVKEEMKRLPANTRIRLKLLYYLCRVTKAGFIIPPCIQVDKINSFFQFFNYNCIINTLIINIAGCI